MFKVTSKSPITVMMLINWVKKMELMWKTVKDKQVAARRINELEAANTELELQWQLLAE